MSGSRLRVLLVVAPMAVGGCNAVQPKPVCKAQPADYAAKYVVQGSPPAMCADQVLTGEILHVQYYRAQYDDPNGAASVAIQPQSVADAIAAGEGAKVAVTTTPDPGGEYSLGRYAANEPGDDNMCLAKTMSVTQVAVAAIPADPNAMPPTEAVPARSLKYTWSNLTMMVTALSNAVYFGADLERQEDDCVIKYKVSAVNPPVFCGDGKKESIDEAGKPVTEDDPTTGKPNPEACRTIDDMGTVIQGSGLNPTIDYVCDASDDGLHGTHLCLVKDQFPAALRK
jgi:hypothetical protein